MHIRSVAVAALLTVGLAGCSSSPSAPKRPEGTVPSGTAQVILDGENARTTTDLACQSTGSITTITIRNADEEITALVDSRKTLTATGVTIANFGGFTGSYWSDLQGSAKATMVEQTYSVEGTAEGFRENNPSARTTETFAIKVAC